MIEYIRNNRQMLGSGQKDEKDKESPEWKTLSRELNKQLGPVRSYDQWFEVSCN